MPQEDQDFKTIHRLLHVQKSELKQIGRYKIISEIGQGGMGKVYKVHDPMLERVVALKLVLSKNEESAQRFLREAKMTARLDHPNIITVYDLGHEQQQLFFTMDFIEGAPLSEFIKKTKVSIKEIVRIIKEVAHAVHYAHNKEIIHRDLKPANIIIDADNVPIVMDFGLAKLVQTQSNLSQDGTIMGTLFYMPPEQAAGKINEIDKRSDIYALGAIFYEMLTNQVPFSGKSFAKVLEKIFNEDVVPPSKIAPKTPKSLENICLKALQKDKNQRYSSVKEFIVDLEKFAQKKETKSASSKVRKRKEKKASFANKKHNIYLYIACFMLAFVFMIAISKTSSKTKISESANKSKSKISSKKIKTSTSKSKIKTSISKSKISLAKIKTSIRNSKAIKQSIKKKSREKISKKQSVPKEIIEFVDNVLKEPKIKNKPKFKGFLKRIFRDKRATQILKNYPNAVVSQYFVKKKKWEIVFSIKRLVVAKIIYRSSQEHFDIYMLDKREADILLNSPWYEAIMDSDELYDSAIKAIALAFAHEEIKAIYKKYPDVRVRFFKFSMHGKVWVMKFFSKNRYIDEYRINPSKNRIKAK